MQTVTLVMLGLLPVLLIAAALSDLATMKIPNWISAALILGFFPVAFMVGMPPMMVALHFGVAVAALFVGMGLFALRVMGGGDAKLMAATCLWLGTMGSGAFVLWTGVAGGVLCLVLIAARWQLQPLAQVGPPWMAQLLRPKGDIPYGVAIAAGGLMAFPSSALVMLHTAGV